MDLRCPECGTRFHVDLDRLRPEGTRVRCSVCGHRWTAYPEDPTPSAAAEAEVEAQPATTAAAEPPPPPESAAGSRRRGGRSSSLLLRSLVVLLVAGLLLELAYAFRSQWLAWPWARTVVTNGLDFVGWEAELPIALNQHRVEAIHARRLTLASGRHVTFVEGLLVNGAPFAQRPPRLELSAMDPGGQVRFRRVREPGARMELSPDLNASELRRRWRQARQDFPHRLQPGQQVPFVVVLDDVPPGVQRFRVQKRE
ncbi:MAG TPA: DUF3426 domain-containing protein [Gammaproteobacteria bacterium]|nr:DUF3426 domain-containing protein [Gammaproteobacteria bacterium]